MNKNLMSVHEVAELTGITVRTLHYYDEIGLLKPTQITEAGYRMYDNMALSRLQHILLFRELEFPLKEIKAKWGNTKAYQEYRQKDFAHNKSNYSRIANELLMMFSELGGLKHLAPNADEVQKKISALQKFITDNYYVCTNEILRGLGEMYVCDKRFQNNIDKAGGAGTADFVKQAIVVYCSKKEV